MCACICVRIVQHHCFLLYNIIIRRDLETLYNPRVSTPPPGRDDALDHPRGNISRPENRKYLLTDVIVFLKGFIVPRIPTPAITRTVTLYYYYYYNTHNTPRTPDIVRRPPLINTRTRRAYIYNTVPVPKVRIEELCVGMYNTCVPRPQWHLRRFQVSSMRAVPGTRRPPRVLSLPP